MRMNLDPLEQYKDEAVWSALEQVTHTDPLFDKRYCPVNSSSRPVRAGNVKSSAWWTVLRKIWQARPVQRPIETLFFAQWPFLGVRGFNLREYFSLDNDPSGNFTPHTISNATEKLRTLSATSNPLHCTTCSGSFENHDRRPPWRFALRGGILLSCHC